MGRDVASFYAQLLPIMRAHGCHRVEGGKGSHEKWVSPINGRKVTVPGPRVGTPQTKC